MVEPDPDRNGIVAQPHDDSPDESEMPKVEDGLAMLCRSNKPLGGLWADWKSWREQNS